MPDDTPPTYCEDCGFTLWWHPTTTPGAKTPKAYCPARRQSVRYFGPRGRRSVVSSSPWVTNLDGRGRAIDRAFFSPTFTAEMVRAFQKQHLDLRAAEASA